MTNERASQLVDLVKNIMDKVIQDGPASLSKKADIEEILEAGKEMISIRNKFNTEHSNREHNDNSRPV